MRPRLEFVSRHTREAKRTKPGSVNSITDSIAGSLEEFMQTDLSLDEHLNLSNPAVYLIKNHGNAMSPRLGNGDILVVNRAIKPVNGSVVVAIINEQFCIREYYSHQTQGECYVELISSNQKYRPLALTPLVPFEIWGVVTWVIGKVTKEIKKV